jgi:hypothetical protein
MSVENKKAVKIGQSRTKTARSVRNLCENRMTR